MKTDKEPWIKVGANLYRRQGIYIAVVKKAGKKIKYSLRTKDPVIAKERLRNYRGGLAKLAKGQMTFRQLAEAWLKDQKTLAESAYKRRQVSVRSAPGLFNAMNSVLHDSSDQSPSPTPF